MIIFGQERPPDVLGGYGVTCVESYDSGGGSGTRTIGGLVVVVAVVVVVTVEAVMVALR